MTPLYRALCEAALSEYGVLEPSVSATGTFLDGSGGDLLRAEDGVALVLQSFAFADAVTGASVGHELVQALAKQLRVEGLEARYQVQCRGGHGLSGDVVEDALHNAARSFAAQRRS